jgi:signal peptidase I
VLGKPVFIWFSWNKEGSGLNKIRWNRIFSVVNGNSEPKSYLIHFVVLVFLYIIGKRILKKKAKE